MGYFGLDLNFEPAGSVTPTDLISRVNKVSAKTINAETINVTNLTGQTILGATFKTATSGERIEIDGTHGFRAYNSSNALITQLKGTITFASGMVDGASLTGGTVTYDKLSVTDLSAITANLGTITSGTITGASFLTSGPGNNRVTMDSTYGLQLIDSGNTTRVLLDAATYAGIQVNGLRSIDTNDIFMESQDQSVQLFCSQASARVSFAIGGATRGYFDSSDGSGAGNLPTSLVVRVNGSLQRVNRASAGGFLYI